MRVLIIFIFIASLSFVHNLAVSTDCLGGTLTTNSALCQAQGYCYWSGTNCYWAECHKVVDIRACRASTSGLLKTNSVCTEITSIDPTFLNQCMEFSQTTLMWAYVRFPTDVTQVYSTQSSSGYLTTQIMTAKYTAAYKYEVLTLNILSATTADLLNIMNAYVQMQYDLCDTEIHPQYLEKAIYESMQAIRDDVTLSLVGTTPLKQDYYKMLWKMTDAYFLKLRSYQPFYVSNKYLVNFGFAHFNRLTIAVSTQFQTTTVSWTTYAVNGYVELLVMPAEQFGFIGVDSDVMIIKPSKLDGTDATLSYSINWSWTYSGTQPTTGSKLYEINKTEMTIGAQTGTTNCVPASKYCTTTISSQIGTKAYLISAVNTQSCSGRYYSRCRLGRCTWTASSNSCA